jgi:polyisoprenoid-binding protein YceI
MLKLNFSLLLLSLAGAANAAEVYNFTDTNKRNTVAIELDAPVESIQGVANAVEGSATIDNNKTSGTFKVRVDSIKTGNDTRDGHLQNDKWLDAAKWPFIELSFKDIVLPATFKDGKPVTVKAKGEMFLHGVKKSEDLEVKIEYMKESEITKNRLPGNLIRVRGTFDIKLSDYNIATSDSAVKKLIGLKVGEVAVIKIDFFGTDAK